MFKELVQESGPERKKCDCCGEHGLHSNLRTEYFNYRTDAGEVVQLSARVPVWSCEVCGDSFTDSRAEDLRHESVCRYLGRLTPSELIDLRENYQCSQAEWAELTGLGVASIKRWESGALIQNPGNDRYLRLLRDRGTFRNLVSIARSNAPETPPPQGEVFRTEISAAAYARAAIFVLRPALTIEP